MTKVTEDAGVKASEEADNKSTATTETPSEDNKETTSTADSQEQADKEIAEELAKDEEKEETEDVADDTDESEESEEEESKDDDAESEQSEEEQEAERSKGAEARKEALQTEIRELVAKRNDLRAENDANIDKHYRTETAEELVDQGLTEAEAENEALKQQLQMRDFKEKVNDLNSQLNIQSLQTLQDFPIFDPDSSEFNEAVRDRAAKLWNQSAGQKVDAKTNLVTDINMMPYDFYKAFAETDAEARADVASKVENSRTEGQIEGQKASDKQLAEAEAPATTAPPRKSRKDPFLAGLTSTED